METSSLCGRQYVERNLLGAGHEGHVYLVTLESLRHDFGSELYERVTDRMQGYDYEIKDSFPLALKAIKTEQGDELLSLQGLQYQTQAFRLTQGPGAVCHGVVPLFAAWRCERSEGRQDIQFTIMPKMDNVEKEFLKLPESELVPFFRSNILRLATLMEAMARIGMRHWDLKLENILFYKCSGNEHQQQFITRQGNRIIKVPACSAWMMLTDFGLTHLATSRKLQYNGTNTFLLILWQFIFLTESRPVPDNIKALLLELISGCGDPLAENLEKNTIWDILFSTKENPIWSHCFFGEEYLVLPQDVVHTRVLANIDTLEPLRKRLVKDLAPRSKKKARSRSPTRHADSLDRDRERTEHDDEEKELLYNVEQSKTSRSAMDIRGRYQRPLYPASYSCCGIL